MLTRAISNASVTSMADHARPRFRGRHWTWPRGGPTTGPTPGYALARGAVGADEAAGEDRRHFLGELVDARTEGVDEHVGRGHHRDDDHGDDQHVLGSGLACLITNKPTNHVWLPFLVFL